jgi:hypothetical protein
MNWSNAVFAVDPRPGAQRLYVAWLEARPEGERVLVQYSKDRGATWSAPKLAAPAERGSQFQLMFAVSREGTVGVAWFDTRDFPRPDGARPDNYHLYFTASVDSGETFLPARRVTQEPSAPGGAGNRAPYLMINRPTKKGLETRLLSGYGRWWTGGDYSGFAADADGAFHVFWPDSRTGTFQVWDARLRVIKPGHQAAAALQEPPGLAPRPVHNQVTLIYDPPLYDRHKAAGELLIRLRNTSAQKLYGPIRAKAIEVEGVKLLNREIDFTAALRDLPFLAPGGVTEPVKVPFRDDGMTSLPRILLEVTARISEGSR